MRAKAIFTIVKVTVEEQRSITQLINYTQTPFPAQISEPRSKHFKAHTVNPKPTKELLGDPVI